ncbi:hypothetical protein J1N35_025545 [Gossypium stocksii]|uniref:RNase H type-1 domain-containing protein n=1 Tax=Gossypium stocksii TaxID=47602 RepID=A0A9D3ZX91_9ROSI|nr:hypothetical protein J1N35_025545 [Gossypium stocksii]
MVKVRITDTVQAKFWGVREGLRLVNVIDVTGCLALINEGWVMEICHILREGNKCANHLASLAQESSGELVVLMDPR